MPDFDPDSITERWRDMDWHQHLFATLKKATGEAVDDFPGAEMLDSRTTLSAMLNLAIDYLDKMAPHLWPEVEKIMAREAAVRKKVVPLSAQPPTG